MPLTPNEVEGPDNPSDEKETQPWPVDDRAVLKWVQDRRKKAEQHLSDWYEEAAEAFRFREGNQWAEEDAEKMESEGRIPVKFNRVGPIIQAILGQEVCNRQEVRYLPRRVSSVGPDGQPMPQLSDPMNDAVKWARDYANAEDEDSDAFADMVTCGMGWTLTDMDYDEDPDGMVRVTRRDPTHMRWDYSARRKNLADMKWVQSDYWMSPEDIEDRWPDSDLDGSVNLSAPAERNKPHDASEAWKYKNNASGKDRYNDELRVIHHVQQFSVPTFRMVDPATGQMREYDKAGYAKLKKNAKLAGVELPDCVKASKRVFWQAWTVGDVVLESGEAPAQKSFPYQCMTCYRERETGFWYGVVRPMIDPQKYANLFMSLMASILANGAKSGVLYETGAFVNPKKAKADWARYNSAIELSQGAIAGQKVQPKPPQTMPQGAAELMQFAIATIRDVTGVNVDMLGGADRDQPGVVEDMRTKAGLTILAGVFDAIRLYRKRQGILLAEFVSRFISDGRLIRVLGQQGEQFIPLIRAQDGMEYDVIVDESPASRDVKERTWEALQVLVPMGMQAGLPMPPSLLDYAPLPQSLALEWKQEISEAQKNPKPDPHMQMEQMKQQTAMQVKQMDNQSRKEELQAQMQAKQQELALSTQAKERELAMQSQAKQAEWAAEQEVQRSNDQRQAELDQRKFELEREKMMLQMRMAEHQHKLDLEAQIQIANIKAAAQVGSAEVSAGQDQAPLQKQEEKAAGYDMGQLMQGLTQALNTLASPQEVVRGPDGRVSGVRRIQGTA